jgi:multiple sugar transport system ATP-binding protein
MIYVTHDQVEAMTMADRIVVMNGGRVEQVGAPLDLYDRPANLFVAGFIGSPSMNFIAGELTPAGFKAGNITLPLPPNAPTSGKATYGVRPEHLMLADDGVEAVVKLVEPMGSETQVALSLGEQSISAVFRERIKAQPGTTIRIRPDANAIHLFDATGTRID